jgi:hypothetical protein
VIRLMAAVVCGLWDKGAAEVARHHLLSLETADLNDANVASRFIEVKKTLRDALQTDIANSGTPHAESLDEETDGLASRCAVQRGTLAKRIPFYNMRYDKGAEQRLFQVLSGRIQEITSVFGTVPDFIVDEWATDMLEDRAWDDNTILTVIAERK